MINLKKLLLCIFTLLLSHQGCAYQRDCFYAGVGIGDALNCFDFKVENVTDFLSIERKKEFNRAIANAFVGYGYTTCESYYFALELGSYFPDRSIKFSRPDLVVNPFAFRHLISIQDFLTGDVLVGLRDDKLILLYLRAGVSYSQIKFKQFENEEAAVPLFEDRRNTAAIRGGVGINFAINCDFGVGFDYVYTYYQNFHTFWPEFDLEFSTRAHAHLFSFSCIYSF